MKRYYCCGEGKLLRIEEGDSAAMREFPKLRRAEEKPLSVRLATVECSPYRSLAVYLREKSR